MTNEPLMSSSSDTEGRTKGRLGLITRVVLAVAIIAVVGGWGVFGVTTVVPNRNDSASVYGAFQANSPFQWRHDTYNLSPGSTVEFVFEVKHLPNGGGCNGYFPNPAARNGTFVAFCTLPTPNSTLTTTLADYVSFNTYSDENCCFGQTFFSWVSGPSGNLTEFQSGGGFFEANQEGNYSMHISNTHFLPPPAVPVGWVNGTLTYGQGRVLFLRPFFSVGWATLGVATVFSAYSLYSFLTQRRKERTGKRGINLVNVHR